MGVFRSHTARPYWQYFFDVHFPYLYWQAYVWLQCGCSPHAPVLYTPRKNVSLSDRFLKKSLASSTFFESFFNVDLGILFRTFTHPIRIQRAASNRTLSYFLQLPAAAVDALGSYRFYWCQLCHASASLLYISCVTCISIPVS